MSQAGKTGIALARTVDAFDGKEGAMKAWGHRDDTRAFLSYLRAEREQLVVKLRDAESIIVIGRLQGELKRLDKIFELIDSFGVDPLKVQVTPK